MNYSCLYLLLNFYLLSIFIYVGWRVSIRKAYWDNVLIAIVSYVFVQGARYGRGNDYFPYLYRYTHGLDENHNEPIFEIFNAFLQWLGVGPHYFLFYYSFVFITCSFIFLNYYKKYALFLMPSFLASVLIFNEYQIRQSLSFSFVFLFIHNLLTLAKDKKRPCSLSNFSLMKLVRLFLCFVLIVGTHKANVLIIIIFVFFYIAFKRPISYKYSIPILVFCAFFIEPYLDLSFLDPILNALGNEDELFKTYAERSEEWFSVEGFETKYERKLPILILETVGCSSYFYFGDKILGNLKDHGAVVLFNVSLFGTIILFTFRKLELMQRMGYDMQLFWFVPIAIILYYYFRVFNKVKISTLSRLSILGVLWFSYEYFKYLLMPSKGYVMFLWDM